MSRILSLFSLLIAALALAPAALAVDGSAGSAIFVFGKAQVVSSNGTVRSLTKGGAVDEGDRVITGANGRVQIRLRDGGLIALRPATEFEIEAFHYAAQDNSDDPFAQRESVSFFSLVKGGFRSLTGAVGQENKEAYRVRTPVATIGIRGTDYDAVLCAGDCAALSLSVGQDVADGLYVGVNSGGVQITNAAGSVALGPQEFGFAGGSAKAPRNSDQAREVLAPATQADVNERSQDEATAEVSNPNEAPAPDTGVQAEMAATTVDLNTGIATNNDASGAVAFANLPGVGVGNTPGGNGNLERAADGSVNQFDNDGVTYAIDTAQSVNIGRDEGRQGATGLSWGRWSGGTVTATAADGSVSTLAVDDSVHWIASADDATAPMVPTSGTQSFDLIGNTDPTDSRGNVGTLGTATLDANFDAQTVDAGVSLSFAQTNEVWEANAQGVDINGAEATFDGAFDDVTISQGGNEQDGSGSLSGFFSGDQDGVINGAGFTYGLTDDSGVDVAGSAAFQAGPDTN
ncbi:MAG: FecR domain-containing protein [Gammaproteobacteria bacterium]